MSTSTTRRVVGTLTAHFLLPTSIAGTWNTIQRLDWLGLSPLVLAVAVCAVPVLVLLHAVAGRCLRRAHIDGGL